jgi:hypothetical protein
VNAIDALGLTFKDGIMLGMLIGVAWSERSRRLQGVRLGRLENAIARRFGLDLGDDSGKHHTKGEDDGSDKGR